MKAHVWKLCCCCGHNTRTKFSAWWNPVFSSPGLSHLCSACGNVVFPKLQSIKSLMMRK